MGPFHKNFWKQSDKKNENNIVRKFAYFFITIDIKVMQTIRNQESQRFTITGASTEGL